MTSVSVVIITKNEEKNIGKTLHALQGFSDDILVIDNGSTDNTCNIAIQHGAKVFTTEWLGYGATKNWGNSHSKYDWILSLDADEVPNEQLLLCIQKLFEKEINTNYVFSIKRNTIFCGKMLQYGGTQNEYRIRLFNKRIVSWDNKSVHEDLLYASSVQHQILEGYLAHYTFDSIKAYVKKLDHYAHLFAKNKKKSITVTIKYIISPLFHFIKNYIIKLGFLDGKAGLLYAKANYIYTRKKYKYILKRRM